MCLKSRAEVYVVLISVRRLFGAKSALFPYIEQGKMKGVQNPEWCIHTTFTFCEVSCKNQVIYFNLWFYAVINNISIFSQ